jgi:phosphoribosylformimino-5-aminoimidazole carboxamide ribotide isomerase
MGFEILPAIDLLGGRVVRLRQGRFDEATVHGDDPVDVARELVDAGARSLHVVDLDGARAGHPVHGRAVEGIVEAAAGRAFVELGGGIRDATAATFILDAGVSRVVLGTAALVDRGLAARLVARHGPGAVAIAIDMRDGRAVGHGWREGAPTLEAAVAVRRLADVGVETFEVTGIDRDGTLEGPDLDALRSIVGLQAGQVIASGGIRSIEDLEAVRDAGCSGAIVGRALYEGHVDLGEALERL